MIGRWKNRSAATTALICAAICPASLAQNFTINGTDYTPKSDWVCEIVLCLANPGGPTEHAECVAPIDKMKSELAKGHSIPKCQMGGAEDNNYAEHRGNCIDLYVDGKLHSSTNWKIPGGTCKPPNTGASPWNSVGPKRSAQQEK